jgi:hypothetical protein
MKCTRPCEEQIIRILKQGEAGLSPRSYVASTGSRSGPSTAGRLSAAGWRVERPSGCGNWNTRTGS